VEAAVTVSQAMSDSRAAFVSTVWPVIRDGCGGGRIVPVEDVSAAEFVRELDVLAGIDAWQILSDNGAGDVMRGIASRVQWGHDWSTFTVRRSVPSGRPTEYDKRSAALCGDRGYLCPHLTVQAYIAGGQLLSVGVATTAAVIAAVDRRNVRSVATGETFFVVPFAAVSGIKVWRREAA
jgi:hypothetical protein